MRVTAIWHKYHKILSMIQLQVTLKIPVSKYRISITDSLLTVKDIWDCKRCQWLCLDWNMLHLVFDLKRHHITQPPFMPFNKPHFSFYSPKRLSSGKEFNKYKGFRLYLLISLWQAKWLHLDQNPVNLFWKLNSNQFETIHIV